MSDQLNKEEEDLLQSALATAFEPTPIIQVSIVPAAPQADATSVSPPAAELTPPPPPEVPAQASIASLEDSSLGDDWKSEYEAQVSEWRARSAEQRTKAEEERKKWEEVRAREEKERNDLAASTFGSGWESLSASGVSIDASSKKAVLSDSQSAVGAEGGNPGEVAPGDDSSRTVSPPEIAGHEKSTSGVDSPKHEKWEDIPSELTSSYPSISFPSDPHSPSSSHHQQDHKHLHPHERDPSHLRHREELPRPGPSGPTFAVFDNNLSRKTRILALFSSLAINVLLPFVNGVMLGFGEIFAKNVVVGWFGWKSPTTVASTVGINAANPKQRSKQH